MCGGLQPSEPVLDYISLARIANLPLGLPTKALAPGGKAREVEQPID